MTAINISTFTKQISDRQLEQLCRDNPETRFETTKEGNLVIMSLTGSMSGKFNMSLAAQLWNWNNQSKLGVVFDSSTGFKLSNGATRSPDVSWIELTRWDSLNLQQKRKFAPIDPDFVIELLSPTDDMSELQQKMLEYRSCGVRLGWLINPDEKIVEIYRHGQDKEVLDNPQTLSGEEVMPNLTVDLSEIFDLD